jgi:hypothetical protein
MTFDPQQLAAAATPGGARLTVDGVEYVVVRSEIFDKYQSLLDADHEELRQRLAASFVANGWDEPGMDAYDSYPANP